MLTDRGYSRQQSEATPFVHSTQYDRLSQQQLSFLL